MLHFLSVAFKVFFDGFITVNVVIGFTKLKKL